MGRIHRAAALLLALQLAACGSGHDAGEDAVQVTELPTGVHAVSTGDPADPVEGKYYAAADGSRLLVLNDAGQQARALYRRAAGGSWQASPGAGTAVELSGSTAIPSTLRDVAAVAGRYAVRLANGAAASLAVQPGGDIVPGGTACRLAGKVAATTLPNALKLMLATSGCGDLPAEAEGYLLVDADYAPATFRLVAIGGKAPLDLWVYPE